MLGLIRAFEDLVRAHPQLPHHLVIVGKETWYAPTVRAAAKKSQVADRIHFTGFVDDEELRRLYGACDLFVYPSFYEGFGLPILEAMACGRAVACSNTSAMPEVADSAALLFDPSSPAGSRLCHARSVVKSGTAPAHGTSGSAAGGDVQLDPQRGQDFGSYTTPWREHASKAPAAVRKSRSVVRR